MGRQIVAWGYMAALLCFFISLGLRPVSVKISSIFTTLGGILLIAASIYKVIIRHKKK